jgi:cation:H+ antiporter
MLIDFSLLIGGVVLLYFGAEWLVAGAAGLALVMRVPQLVVGLTVVAYGTSAPEVIVGVQAALSGHGDIALGNVIGSNIANLGLILAIATMIRPALVDQAVPRRELPVLLLGTVCVPVFLYDGEIQRWNAALLLLGAIGYTGYMLRSVRGQGALREVRIGAEVTAEAADAAGAPVPSGSRRRLVTIAAVGLAILLLGGHLLVSGATSLARVWGMSERLVGLTIVALGTSLPELVTTAIAARRGHSDIAVGNVMGSNIFNALLCLGAAAMVAPIRAPLAAVVVELGVLLGITVVAAVFVRSARTMARWEGGVLLAIFAAFMLYLIRAGGA